MSPLLSNVYLNLLDRLWGRRGYAEKLGATLCRYADDMVVLCRGNPRTAWEALAAVVSRMGLSLHPDKTRIVRVEEGFEFLSELLLCPPSQSDDGQAQFLYLPLQGQSAASARTFGASRIAGPR